MLKLFERKQPATVDINQKAEEESTKQNELSVFKDPFDKANIEEIHIWYNRELFTKKYVWEGRVKFTNGLTKGEQSTPSCDSWESLVAHMKQIYDSLAVKP